MNKQPTPPYLATLYQVENNGFPDRYVKAMREWDGGYVVDHLAIEWSDNELLFAGGQHDMYNDNGDVIGIQQVTRLAPNACDFAWGPDYVLLGEYLYHEEKTRLEVAFSFNIYSEQAVPDGWGSDLARRARVVWPDGDLNNDYAIQSVSWYDPLDEAGSELFRPDFEFKAWKLREFYLNCRFLKENGLAIPRPINLEENDKTN